ncbi:endonuclease [Hymenobacter coalescens]
MKHFFAALLAAGLGLASATAQVLPPAAPSNLQGVALRDWLRQNWYDGLRVDLGYSDARGKMYNYVDVFNNQLTCVYSGYSVPKTLDSTSVSTANVGLINCEHSIPQSWFNEVSRMRSDIHHLYPTYTQWNSNRGSDPFGELPDAQTQTWMRGTVSQSTIPTTNIAEWSEDTNSMFEPREDHKGNLARTAFYFYTMHANETFDPGKNVITALADLPTLYQWHLADPVDARERERNRRAAKAQGNFNPYIVDPSLVARAWGFAPAGPTVSFAAATGSAAEGNSGTTTYTATLTVSPAPTAAVTVQVGLNTASSTATSPADYTFSPQTVTFAAGQTSQTVAVTINGDTQPEADETVRLVLQTTSAGLSVGSPNTHDLTIRNDDGNPAQVQFFTTGASSPEGNSGLTNHTIIVSLSGVTTGVAFPLTVPVTVDPASTASSPGDYNIPVGSVTFQNAAAQTASFSLEVNGDTQVEPNETVRLVLGTPSDASVVLAVNRTYTHTIANDDAPAPGSGGCDELFFSEYVESSGATRAVEIYNPSASPVDLTGYRLLRFANGSRTPQAPYSLSGTIAPGGTYVVATPGSVAAVLALANATSTVVDFNGDDAMALFNGTDTLDIIGVIGQQLSWPVAGGTTLNNTLRRLATVGGGSTNWTTAAAGWQAAGVDAFADLGRHTSTACTVTGTAKAAALGTGIQVFPNPAADALYLRLPGLSGRRAASIGLYDGLGRQVLRTQRTLNGAEAAALTLPVLPAGLYTVRVTVDGVQYSARVAVQR